MSAGDMVIVDVQVLAGVKAKVRIKDGNAGDSNASGGR